MAMALRDHAGVPVEVAASTPSCPMAHAFSVQPPSCARVAAWVGRGLVEEMGGGGVI